MLALQFAAGPAGQDPQKVWAGCSISRSLARQSKTDWSSQPLLPRLDSLEWLGQVFIELFCRTGHGPGRQELRRTQNNSVLPLSILSAHERYVQLGISSSHKLVGYFSCTRTFSGAMCESVHSVCCDCGVCWDQPSAVTVRDDCRGVLGHWGVHSICGPCMEASNLDMFKKWKFWNFHEFWNNVVVGKNVALPSSFA